MGDGDFDDVGRCGFGRISCGHSHRNWFLSTFKTPGGAPIPPDIVNQIKNFSKLEHVLFGLPKIDLDEQSFVLIALSRDRKIASDFVKLAFPLVKKIPLL